MASSTGQRQGPAGGRARTLPARAWLVSVRMASHPHSRQGRGFLLSWCLFCGADGPTFGPPATRSRIDQDERSALRLVRLAGLDVGSLCGHLCQPVLSLFGLDCSGQHDRQIVGRLVGLHGPTATCAVWQ